MVHIKKEKKKKYCLKKWILFLSLNSEFGHVFCFGQQDKIKLIRAETLKAFIYWGLTFLDAFETENHGVNMPLASFLQDTWPHEELRWHGQILPVYNMWIRLAMIICCKRAYDVPMSAAPRAPAPVAVHCWPLPAQETLKHSSVSVSVGFLGRGAHKFCLSPLSISGRYWF